MPMRAIEGDSEQASRAAITCVTARHANAEAEALFNGVCVGRSTKSSWRARRRSTRAKPIADSRSDTFFAQIAVAPSLRKATAPPNFALSPLVASPTPACPHQPYRSGKGPCIPGSLWPPWLSITAKAQHAMFLCQRDRCENVRDTLSCAGLALLGAWVAATAAKRTCALSRGPCLGAASQRLVSGPDQTIAQRQRVDPQHGPGEQHPRGPELHGRAGPHPHGMNHPAQR